MAEKKRLSRLVADATQLEVTSMFVNGITGRKLPDNCSAYLEVLNGWVHQFINISEDLRRDNIRLNEDSAFEKAVQNWLTNSPELFKKCDTKDDYSEQFFKEDTAKLEDILNVINFDEWRRKIKVRITTRAKSDDYGSTMLRMMRIQKRLNFLKERLKAFYSEDYDPENDVERPEDAVMYELRKLWELKDGFVIAQHSVHLDGDIISRYNARLFQERLVEGQMEGLLEFHRKNVELGMKQWHFVFDTIVHLSKAIGAKIVSLVRIIP